MRPDCPNPDKMAHRSQAAALKHRDNLEQKNGIDLTPRPYLCACGSWHLGHSTKRTRLARRTTRRPR